jgi:hypothetical protein
VLGTDPPAEWTSTIQQVTVAAELGMTGPQWKECRDELWSIDDKGLLHLLRAEPAGEELAVSVVDAVMRALPQRLALGERGLFVNALLARHPQNRWVRPWVPVVRRPARWMWLRWTSRIGQNGAADTTRSAADRLG